MECPVGIALEQMTQMRLADWQRDWLRHGRRISGRYVDSVTGPMPTLALAGSPIQDVQVWMEPVGWLSKVLCRWLVYRIEAKWKVIPED